MKMYNIILTIDIIVVYKKCSTKFRMNDSRKIIKYKIFLNLAYLFVNYTYYIDLQRPTINLKFSQVWSEKIYEKNPGPGLVQFQQGPGFLRAGLCRHGSIVGF